jgi:hypothetical protein
MKEIVYHWRVHYGTRRSRPAGARAAHLRGRWPRITSRARIWGGCRDKALMSRHERPPLFYTRRELIKMGVEARTVDRLVREGCIRAKKVGRQLHLNPTDVEREISWPGSRSQEQHSRGYSDRTLRRARGFRS